MTLTDFLADNKITAAELGRRIGVSRSMMIRLISGKRAMTAEYAIKIETATGGQVTRSELRPDLWPQEAA